MQPKVVIQGNVEKQNSKKFKVKAHKKDQEVDIDIEIDEEGEYEVEKLSVDNLPQTIDGNKITWLNNFAIKDKKADKYINQSYKVRIPGIGNKTVVLLDNNSNGNPYYYTGPVVNDTIELSDGDPAIGKI